MGKVNPDVPATRKISIGKRNPITASQADWIKTSRLQCGEAELLVIQPEMIEVDLAHWASNNRDFIERSILKRGAILFRGFNMHGAQEFERFLKSLCSELLEYRERSSPRHQVYENIYTSTDYPASQNMFLHNENSYQEAWPMKIFFFCLTPAEQGGETPIADVRRVYNRISPAIIDRFKQRKCMYVRNFDDAFGLSWQNVFQTMDRAVVEQYCSKTNIELEWRDNNRLRTRVVRHAIAAHPRTGEMVWFNHVAFFHVSTLPAQVRDGLLMTMREEDLPANTYYGDGSPIEATVLDELRDAYRQETLSFPWDRGDILMLDNMLMAHSRTAFVGPRKVLVGMAEPFNRHDN